MFRNRYGLLCLAVAAVYLACAGVVAVTKAPWWDEAWFLCPVWNLLHKGFLGTTVLDPASSTWKQVRLDGIDRYTYWVMPLHFVVQAAWLKLVGFGVVQARVLSIGWGLLALGGWWFVVRELTGDRRVALLAAALMATEYYFVTRAADGRMDMLCLALGVGGAAVYLSLRKRPGEYGRAVAAGHTLVAASVLAHPNGLIYFALLAWMVLLQDWSRWRARYLALAAAPYLAGALAWGVYIAKAPHLFLVQFVSNASGRGPGITQPWAAVKLEFTHRYLDSYGFGAWNHGVAHIKILIPVLYVAALAGCLLSRRIRGHSGTRVILAATLTTVLYLTFFEGLKTESYLAHIVTFYSAVLALAVCQLPPRRLMPAALAVVLAACLLIQGSWIAALAWRNRYGLEYIPAMRWMMVHTGPDDLVMGSAEAAFALGFDRPVLDDVRLGYNTGKHPRFIVIERRYEDNIGVLAKQHPAIYRHTQSVLKNYAEVYAQKGYRIYESRP